MADEPEKITFAELVEKLGDPDIPESDLKPYLTVDRDNTIGMAPVLMPNMDRITLEDAQSSHMRARANLGMGFLNAVCRSRRQNQFENRLEDRDSRPILLAEGDSWFQYPVWLDDVIDHLSDHYNIMCLSAAGDLLEEMVEDGEIWDYLEGLRDDGHTVRALLLSGGGNDIVGDSLKELLNPHDGSEDAAAHINQAMVAEAFGAIEAGYRAIFRRVRDTFPDLPILIHGYDYAQPLPEQGSNIPPLDGWLGEPMRDLNIPDGPLQAAIIHILINRINDIFAGLDQDADTGVAGVHYVNNRNTVQGRWHDEMHPLDEGFGDVAGKFRQKLSQLGI